MLSKERQDLVDAKILKTVQVFLDYHCRISDQRLGEVLQIPKSTVGRYLTSERTKQLIGIDNYAYIRKERDVNQL